MSTELTVDVARELAAELGGDETDLDRPIYDMFDPEAAGKLVKSMDSGALTIESENVRVHIDPDDEVDVVVDDSASLPA